MVSEGSQQAGMAMMQATHEVNIKTQGRGLYEFTGDVRDWLVESKVRQGLITAFVRHTSASLLIQENYDPEVRRDLERFFARLVPDGDPLFRHDTEGPDDMPAHVRTALTQTHLAIPIVQGELGLGTWQGIYLYEHRKAPQRRQVLLHLLGD
jgi:secondary thiamine-phosphate synthase enzyme